MHDKLYTSPHFVFILKFLNLAMNNDDPSNFICSVGLRIWIKTGSVSYLEFTLPTRPDNILSGPWDCVSQAPDMFFNLSGTKFLGNCMCYHGRVIIEGCRTKCVIDKHRPTNIFIFWSSIDIHLRWHMNDYCMNITVVPATSGPLGERPPALAGHFCDVPTTLPC